MFNTLIFLAFLSREQPPSGGCVLKPQTDPSESAPEDAATFGWLCVETPSLRVNRKGSVAATFGWLCVETRSSICFLTSLGAATFGWLCVETAGIQYGFNEGEAATFGWLCVETVSFSIFCNPYKCSHLRVAVC